MAYQTYITEALVCGNRNRNTSDKAYLLFTREAGMVWANARSVRKESSKQRYALQDFTHIRLSLISGKAGWRIAGVESFENMYAIAESREARTLVRNTVRLMQRVIRGEESHQEMFDDIVESLYKSNDFDSKKFELIISLRLLNVLGYISPKKPYKQFLENIQSYDDIKNIDAKQEAECKKAVEHALIQSQL